MTGGKPVEYLLLPLRLSRAWWRQLVHDAESMAETAISSHAEDCTVPQGQIAHWRRAVVGTARERVDHLVAPRLARGPRPPQLEYGALARPGGAVFGRAIERAVARVQ